MQSDKDEAFGIAPLRRHFGSSAAGGRLHSSGSFRSWPAFAWFRLHRLGSVGHCLADALPLFCSGGFFAAIVAFGWSFALGGCFASRYSWLVKWMLCHLCCVGDLRSLDVVVSFARFSSVIGARFVGSWESPPELFLAILVCCWAILPNSLCLLRFVYIGCISLLLMNYMFRHIRKKNNKLLVGTTKHTV